MTELLQTNRMEDIELMFEAKHVCFQRGIKSVKHKQKRLQSLEKVFKDISYNITTSTLKVNIKSIDKSKYV